MALDKELVAALEVFRQRNDCKRWHDCCVNLYQQDKAEGLAYAKGFRSEMTRRAQGGDAEAYEWCRKSYLLTAKDVFDDYMVFVEWRREPSKKFWLPRRSVLLPVVMDIQRLVDDDLDLLAISLPPGTGKAQPLYSKVLTPSGFVKMGDIKVGDSVISGDGKPCNVIGVYPQGIKSVYRVTFNDDTSTECCKEHLWYGQSRDDRCANPWRSEPRYRIFDLETMMNNVTVESGRRLNYSIDFVKPVEFEKKEMLLHPYVMGVLLGDGSITGSNLSITFTSNDAELVDYVRALLPDTDVIVRQGDNGYRIVKIDRSKGCHEKAKTRQAIDAYGLLGTNSKTKFIPQDYLLSSAEDRWELLRGLLDTDGYASRGNTAEFTTVSERLADGVVTLVRSLGGRVTVATKIGTYTKDGERISCSKVYRLCIVFSSEAKPFKLSRKANAYKPKREQIKKFVKLIEYAGEAECQCIMVDSPTHLYVTDDYIATHNTSLKIFLLSWLIGKYPDRPNLDSGHSGMMTQSTYDGVLAILMDKLEYAWAEVFPTAGGIITNAKELTIDIGKKHRFSSLTCRAIGASLTGATRCEGLLSADDLVSGIEEALSKDRLDKKWDAYNNDLKSRKKLGCKELHISTRWSVHDVIGRLERQYGDNERAKFIVVPALSNEGVSNFNYGGGVGFDTTFFEDMKNSLDEASFLALYQNEPIERTGLLYSEEELRRYFELPDGEPDAVLSILDPKDKGKDYAFMPVAYLYGEDYYIDDCVCNQGIITDEIATAMLLKHKVKACRVESNNAGGKIAEKIQRLIKERKGITHITLKWSQTNKETRIIVNSEWVKDHCLFKHKSLYSGGSEYGTMIRLLTTYSLLGGNKNDDVPDGMAMLADFVQALAGNVATVMKRPF